MNKIEHLIEKYQKNYKEMRLEIPTWEIISDLQSLQEPTEENFTSFAIWVVEDMRTFKDTMEDWKEMQPPFVYCFWEDTQENRNAQVNSLKRPVA